MLQNLFHMLIMLSCVMFFSCAKQTDRTHAGESPHDINSVKESHTSELMALEGVAGVYIGQRNDRVPCIVVMVVKKSPGLLAKIPSELEGYPVLVEETGQIKPMK